MIAPLYDPEPLSARIYAAKIDQDYDLKNEWMMVVRPRHQYATFHSVEPYTLPRRGTAFPGDNPYTTPRFIVQFADLAEDADGLDAGPCIVFPTFTEDLESRWHKSGEIMVERDRLISLIRTVGVFSPKDDEDWTERVILSIPDIEEQDITEAKVERNTGVRHESIRRDALDDITREQLVRMELAAC